MNLDYEYVADENGEPMEFPESVEFNLGFTPDEVRWLNEPQQRHERGEHDFEADIECEACRQVIEEGGDCYGSPTGGHEFSDTLCVWCLEYVVDGSLTPCPSPVDRFHEASDTLCVWCLQYIEEREA